MAVPTLKVVDKLLKNKKDPDFLQLFDTTKTQYYSTLRHKYDLLYETSRKEFEHLRLFTKHLKKVIEKNKGHFEGLKEDFLEYRREEPSLQPIRHSVTNTRTEDEISLHLPAALNIESGVGVSGASGNGNDTKKMTEEAMADVYNYDWKLVNLGSMFYNRLELEVSNPLSEFRKQYQQKLHKTHESVSQGYDKMVKHGMSMREKQVQANVAWNELCDCRARLDKAIKNKKEKSITKHNSRVQSAIKKVKKMFEEVVEMVDKYNVLQEQFWNTILVDGVNQIESISHCRGAFMQEYMTKYLELLDWKRAEERNGEEEIQQVMTQLMSPTDCVRTTCNQIGYDHGNYQNHDVTDYQIPCMPNEVATVVPPLSQQRIDPTVILPIYDPFGDELNNATSGGKRMSSVRSVSSVRNKSTKNANATTAILTSQRNSFFADSTAKLFARTANTAAHRMSVTNGATPTSGSTSTSPKHSSLSLYQSVSRTSSLDDAKEEKDKHKNDGSFFPGLKRNRSIENSPNTPNNANDSDYNLKKGAPPLPPRTNSSAKIDTNAGAAFGTMSANKPVLPVRPPGGGRSGTSSPQRGRSGATSPSPNNSNDTDSSDSDTDTDTDSTNTRNMSASVSGTKIHKNRPSRPLPSAPGGKNAPPPPKKDAKSVATLVVRKHTLESGSAPNASVPPLPPRGRPKWKMTMT